MNPKIKLIIGLFIGLVVIVMGLFIYSLANPKGQLVIYIAPEAGTLKINGKEQQVKNEQSLALSPGDYSISFSRDEFDGETTQKVSIEKDINTDVVFVLNPLTDRARELLTTPGSQKVIERYSGKVINKEAAEIVEKNPILNILPIRARLYVVSSCLSVAHPEDKTKIALCAVMTEHGLEPYIRKDIQSRGFNPDELEIIYTVAGYDPDI